MQAYRDPHNIIRLPLQKFPFLQVEEVTIDPRQVPHYQIEEEVTAQVHPIVHSIVLLLHHKAYFPLVGEDTIHRYPESRSLYHTANY